MSPPVSPALSDAPRVYPARPWVRRLAGALAALGVVLAGIGLMAVVVEDAPGLGIGAGTGIVAAVAALGATYLWRLRVVLTHDRIEAGSWRLRGLDRRDIAGYRLIPTPSGTRVLLMPHDPVRHRPVEFVAEALLSDEVLTEWVDTLPHLAEPAHPDDDPGSEPPASAVTALRARRVLRGVELASIVIVLGGIVTSGIGHPLALILAAGSLVLFPVALGLTYWRPRLFPLGFEARPGDRRAPATSTVLLFSGLGLTLAVLGQQVTILAWSQALVWCGAAGLVAIGAVAGAESPTKRWRPSRLLLLYPFAVLYGASAVLWLDIALDRGVVDRIPAQVVDTRVVDHGRGSDTYELRLLPGTSDARPTWVEVRWSVAEQVKVGGVVCGVTHPGALGLRWFRVEVCPAGVPVTADPDARWPGGS